MSNKQGGGSLHEGHRKRMYERYKTAGGLDSFTEHEIMEMLLYFCYPRGNTNDIAHRLINRFGSVEGVLSAGLPELTDNGYIGENPALKLKFLNDVYHNMKKEKSRGYVDSSDIEALEEYIGSKFSGIPVETVMIFYCDSLLRVRKSAVVCQGDFDMTLVDTRNLMRLLLNGGCRTFFLAHNHPNGSKRPSAGDVYSTRQLIEELRKMDFILLDHFVVGDNGVCSMREIGYIKDWE